MGWSSAVPIVKSGPARFQFASTWPNAMVGLARVASIVAWVWLNPTVMIVWQLSSMRRWMLAA